MTLKVIQKRFVTRAPIQLALQMMNRTRKAEGKKM